MADVPVSQPQPAEAPRARAFAGRPTIITGGAGVLGRVFADALAAEGAPIGIIDLDGERARALAEHLSSAHDVKARGVGADVLDREQLQAAADELAGAIGSARCLINAAGGNVAAATTLAEQIEDTTDLDSESFFGLSMSAFDQAIDLNLKGTVLPTQVFARSMIEAGDGAILNISSMNAYRPLTRIPAYAAGKSAVTNFTAWLAVHLAPRRVRVNAIAPGVLPDRTVALPGLRRSGRVDGPLPPGAGEHPHAPFRRAGRTRRRGPVPVVRPSEFHHRRHAADRRRVPLFRRRLTQMRMRGGGDPLASRREQSQGAAHGSDDGRDKRQHGPA